MAELLEGFMSLRDLLAERVVNNVIPVVSDAVMQSIAEHNRTVDLMRQLFTDNTTDHMARYKTPVAAVLQPLSEDGRAKPVKRTGFYDVAWPLKRAGTAWGANYETRVQMTVQEANDMTDFMLDQDLRWNAYQMIGALMTKEPYVFPDEQWGNLTIQPLANGDATTYIIRPGEEAGEPANHYVAQADALDDAHNYYATDYRTLKRRPENAEGRVIAFHGANLRQPTENLAAFVEAKDPDVQQAANVPQLVQTLDVPVPGETYGKVGKVWVNEWARIPDNYILYVVSSGPRPLRFRQPAVPELQGFVAEAEREDYPFWERQYKRRGGYGGWNRIAALVRLVGAGAYVSPPQYKQPFG
jgi:hypothetical protein